MPRRSPHRICAVCGGGLRTVTEPVAVRVGARSVDVREPHLKCASCGEIFYAAGQLETLQARAARLVREADALLQPDEIRALRERLGLTQADFERLLGVGPKTVVRWERGTVCQNGATDSLLRVLKDVPAAVRYLAAARGVKARSA